MGCASSVSSGSEITSLPATQSPYRDPLAIPLDPKPTPQIMQLPGSPMSTKMTNVFPPTTKNQAVQTGEYEGGSFNNRKEAAISPTLLHHSHRRTASSGSLSGSKNFIIELKKSAMDPVPEVADGVSEPKKPETYLVFAMICLY